MTLKQQLKETKAKNLQRMKELEKDIHMSPEEWQEYHFLKHKYQSQKCTNRQSIKSEGVALSDKQDKQGSDKGKPFVVFKTQNPAPAENLYKLAIKECLRRGRPRDMSITDWKKYQKWAKEKLKELGKNPAPAKFGCMDCYLKGIKEGRADTIKKVDELYDKMLKEDFTPDQLLALANFWLRIKTIGKLEAK